MAVNKKLFLQVPKGLTLSGFLHFHTDARHKSDLRQVHFSHGNGRCKRKKISYDNDSFFPLMWIISIVIMMRLVFGFLNLFQLHIDAQQIVDRNISRNLYIFLFISLFPPYTSLFLSFFFSLSSFLSFFFRLCAVGVLPS